MDHQPNSSSECDSSSLEISDFLGGLGLKNDVYEYMPLLKNLCDSRNHIITKYLIEESNYDNCSIDDLFKINEDDFSDAKVISFTKCDCEHNRYKLELSAIDYFLSMIYIKMENKELSKKHLLFSWRNLKSKNISNEKELNSTTCCCVSYGFEKDISNLINYESGLLIGLKLRILKDFINLNCLPFSEKNAIDLKRCAKRYYEYWIKLDNFNNCHLIDFAALISSSSIQNIANDLEYNKINGITDEYMEILDEMTVHFYQNGKEDESALTCIDSLRLKLDYVEIDRCQLAFHVAELNSFYKRKSQFNVSRHLLQVACRQLELYEKASQVNENAESILEKKNNLNKTWANLNILTLEYVSALLEYSKDNEKPVNVFLDDQFRLMCDDDLRQINHIQRDLPCKRLENFEEARDLFKIGLQCATEAKKYYTLEEFCSNYVDLEQNCADLYKLLAHFEQDTDRKCRMLKRRVDILNEVQSQLSERHYLHALRQLYSSLGSTFNELGNLKKKSNSPKISHERVKKFNTLYFKGIDFYLKFLDSYKENGKLPTKFDDKEVNQILLAFIMIGRMHSEMFFYDSNEQKEHLDLAIISYTKVIEYGKHNMNQMNNIKELYEFAENLKKTCLNPGKIDKI